MNSELLTLGWVDAWKGLQMFVITSLVMTIGGAVLQEGFSVWSADWIALGKNSVDVAVISTVSYIIKNFLTGKDGEFLVR